MGIMEMQHKYSFSYTKSLVEIYMNPPFEREISPNDRNFSVIAHLRSLEVGSLEFVGISSWIAARLRSFVIAMKEFFQ